MTFMTSRALHFKVIMSFTCIIEILSTNWFKNTLTIVAYCAVCMT